MVLRHTSNQRDFSCACFYFSGWCSPHGSRLKKSLIYWTLSYCTRLSPLTSITNDDMFPFPQADHLAWYIFPRVNLWMTPVNIIIKKHNWKSNRFCLTGLTKGSVWDEVAAENPMPEYIHESGTFTQKTGHNEVCCEMHSVFFIFLAFTEQMSSFLLQSTIVTPLFGS